MTKGKNCILLFMQGSYRKDGQKSCEKNLDYTDSLSISKISLTLKMYLHGSIMELELTIWKLKSLTAWFINIINLGTVWIKVRVFLCILYYFRRSTTHENSLPKLWCFLYFWWRRNTVMITVYTMYTLGQPFVALYKTEGLLCFQFV